MRLEVTRRADLATRTLALLSRSGRRLKAGELAVELGTTTGFVPQIIAPLISHSWVRSDPGPTGGYFAEGDLSHVSVLDVIEAVDGPTETGRCVLQGRACEGNPPCVLHEPWSRARRALIDELAGTAVTSVPIPPLTTR